MRHPCMLTFTLIGALQGGWLPFLLHESRAALVAGRSTGVVLAATDHPGLIV